MTPRLRLVMPLAACSVWLGISLAWAQTLPSESATGAKSPSVSDLMRAEDERQAEITRRSRSMVAQLGAIDAQRYILGPGDVLELDLWGPLTKTTALVVSPEGTVSIPSSGPIVVSGKTLAWARQRILDQVSKTYRGGVQADVRLTQLRTFKVYVLGAVKTPGPVAVSSVTRASEAVSGVGFEEDGSKRNIEIRRRDGTQRRLDFELFLSTGRDSLDPTLVDGDVIMVPHAREYIGVAGGISVPGRYEYAPGDSVSTLLALSRGLLPAASPEPALLVRFKTPSERESLWVDLAQLNAGKDIPLQDGDQLFVAMRPDFHRLPFVAVVGEVERPGSYPIVIGRDRFTDLIGWARGFRPYANRASIVLLRETVDASQSDPEFDRLARLSRSEMTESEYTKFQTRLAERKNSFRLDWTRIEKGGADVDPLLQANDVVRVEQLVPTVRIEGQVRRPGLIEYLPGRTLKEYIDLAGGFTDRAASAHISVSRTLTGQVIPARNLGNIQAGDFIWIPERRDVDTWAVFRDVIGVAAQVAVIIYTLSR